MKNTYADICDRGHVCKYLQSLQIIKYDKEHIGTYMTHCAIAKFCKYPKKLFIKYDKEHIGHICPT